MDIGEHAVKPLLVLSRHYAMQDDLMPDENAGLNPGATQIDSQRRTTVHYPVIQGSARCVQSSSGAGKNSSSTRARSPR